MSISVMKQALDAITNVLAGGDFDNPYADLKEAGAALKQAIAEAEKQEPVAWADMEVRGEDKGLSWTPGYFHTQPLYTAPVHASDISEKDVHISNKYRHEWIGLDPEMMRNTPIEFNRGALWAERYLKEKNASYINHYSAL